MPVSGWPPIDKIWLSREWHARACDSLHAHARTCACMHVTCACLPCAHTCHTCAQLPARTCAHACRTRTRLKYTHVTRARNHLHTCAHTHATCACTPRMHARIHATRVRAPCHASTQPLACTSRAHACHARACHTCIYATRAPTSHMHATTCIARRASVHTRTHGRTHGRMHARTHALAHTCTHACMHAHIHIALRWCLPCSHMSYGKDTTCAFTCMRAAVCALFCVHTRTAGADKPEPSHV